MGNYMLGGFLTGTMGSYRLAFWLCLYMVKLEDEVHDP